MLDMDIRKERQNSKDRTQATFRLAACHLRRNGSLCYSDRHSIIDQQLQQSHLSMHSVRYVFNPVFYDQFVMTLNGPTNFPSPSSLCTVQLGTTHLMGPLKSQV